MKTVLINNIEYPTYATLEDAEIYFNAEFDSNWQHIENKEQLLVTATRIIDKKDFQGEKVEATQPLKFPRIIAGQETDENLLMVACCELANNIFKDGGKDADISNLKSVSLGDSSITFKEDGKTENDDDLLIEQYLSDYLIGGVRVIL